MAITKTESGKLRNSNKVVTDIGIDNVPTTGSDNLVTSDGIAGALDSKADKNNIYTKQESDDKFKTKQTAVSDPTAGNTPASAFISGITQNANGEINPVKSPLPPFQAPLTFDNTPTEGSSNPVTSDGIKQAIDAATPSDYDAVKTQVQQNTTDIGTNTQSITGINSKIPAQASAQNQLADKAFVNSSIQTNTATFRGTYNLVTDLGLTVSSTEQQTAAAIATHLASLVPPVVPENNDYVFVQIPRATEDPADFDPTVIVRYDRYKCTVEEAGGVVTRTWAFEFSLNNSSFTADQWAAVNSGITSGLVAKLGALPTAVDLAAALLAKYEKPLTGIPKSDLSDGVQASLDKADTALQTAPVTSVNSKTGAVVLSASDVSALGNSGDQTLDGDLTLGTFATEKTLWFKALTGILGITNIGGYDDVNNVLWKWPTRTGVINNTLALLSDTMRFSTEYSYVVGDVVFYSGSFYRCTTAHRGPWDASDFAEVLGGLSTGTPTAPTPTAGDDSTKIATTAFVKGALPYAIASVPSGDALADRTVNTKTVNAATYAPSFPAETSGKSCDFYLAITSDTAGTVSAPSGKTLNNAKGESANLDYEANKTTVLRFTQISANTYVVTGGANGGGSVDPAQLATKLDSEAAAPDYDATATYAEGKYVTYLGKLYYAKQAITTAEEWTPAHWQEDRLAPYIKTFASAITALSQRGYVIDDNGQPIAVFPDGTVPQIDGYPLRYSIPTSVVLTATNDEATLVLTDRAVTNATIATGFSTLNLTFPTAISGKVRDFYMRITVAAGESAPAMVLPQGITAETPDGSLPAIADGDTSAASTTIVYFSETSSGTFIVKAETVTTVASAA